MTLMSCASYNAGESAIVKNGDSSKLSVKGELVRDYTTDNFILINVGFENMSENWKRFKYVEMVETDSIKDAKVVVGNDLVTWSESMKTKLAVDQHNRSVLVGSIAGLAAVGAGVVSGNNGDLKLAKGLVIGGSALLSLEAINEVSKKADALELASLVPRSHLYHPFAVAPGLVSKKWILLQIKKDHIPCFVDFQLTDIADQKTHYRLDLNVCTKGSYTL